MRECWRRNSCRLLLIFYVQIFPLVRNSVPLMNDGVDYDYIPPILFPDYQNEDIKHYNSAFEEANATFNDFENQTLFLYKLICHQSCIGERTILPNRYCDECYCDKSCKYYGDCCPDVLDNEELVVPSRCSPLYVPASGTHIKMIHYCPNEDDQLQEYCSGKDNSQINLTQPVSDVITGLVYRNLFCARCHGVQNYLPWDIGMTCGKELPTFQYPSFPSSVYLDIINKEGCRIQYSPVGNITGHYCFREGELISSCNTTGEWLSFDPFIEKACLTVPRASILHYKNIFCFICNTFRSWKQIKSMYTGYDPIPFSVSLSSLLDLSDEKFASDVEEDDFMTCPSFMIYDPHRCVCRNVTCVNGKKYENGECKSVFALSYAILYSVPLILDITFKFSLVESIDTSELKDIVANEVSQIDGRLAWVIISVQYVSPCAENINLKYRISAHVYFNKPVNTDEFEKNLVSEIPEWGSSNKYTLKGARLKFKLSVPDTQIGQYIMNSDFTIPCKSFNSPLAVYGLYPDEHNSLMWSSRRVNFDKVQACRSVFLDASEAFLLNRNTSLYIRSNNMTLDLYEFRIEENGYHVCIEDYIPTQKTTVNTCEKSYILSIKNKNVSVLGIMSGVCTSFSLLFLFITFLVFCCLKKLRTSIGLPLMALTITLFLAQALFEFGAEQVEIPWVCQTLGILTHLFWLSAIFWMNVCTIILFYKLCYPMKSRVTSTYKTMLYSILYALLFPIIIVSLVAVPSYLILGNIGYGGQSCYITTATARRFGFALPVAVLISVNIALFSYTFIKLKKQHKNLQSNQENEISMWACLKLSTITGLTWSFAFIYEATRQEIFSYLFTVFVGAQGCILFFVFVCNKRVKDEINRLLSRSKTPINICNHSRNGETSSTSDQKVTVEP